MRLRGETRNELLVGRLLSCHPCPADSKGASRLPLCGKQRCKVVPSLLAQKINYVRQSTGRQFRRGIPHSRSSLSKARRCACSGAEGWHRSAESHSRLRLDRCRRRVAVCNSRTLASAQREK